MFRKKKNIDSRMQIPEELFVSIHEPQIRRKRWLLEVLLSLVIVIALVAGGMFAYKKLHHTTPAAPATSSITQSPQQAPKQQSVTSAPVTTPVSGSTNSSSVDAPR